MYYPTLKPNKIQEIQTVTPLIPHLQLYPNSKIQINSIVIQIKNLKYNRDSTITISMVEFPSNNGLDSNYQQFILTFNPVTNSFFHNSSLVIPLSIPNNDLLIIYNNLKHDFHEFMFTNFNAYTDFNKTLSKLLPDVKYFTSNDKYNHFISSLSNLITDIYEHCCIDCHLYLLLTTRNSLHRMGPYYGGIGYIQGKIKSIILTPHFTLIQGRECDRNPLNRLLFWLSTDIEITELHLDNLIKDLKYDDHIPPKYDFDLKKFNLKECCVSSYLFEILKTITRGTPGQKYISSILKGDIIKNDSHLPFERII